MNQPALIFLLFFLFFSCKKSTPDSSGAANQYNIIPLPVSLTPKTGQFQIDGDTKILLLSNDEGLKTAAAHLASVLIKTTGTTVVPVEGEAQKDAILFSLDPSIEHEEGYQLNVTPYEVTIKAKTGAGAFYAVQTLRQLMPVEAEQQQIASFSIPCVEITDAPRYTYRGMHLDVGRHFFSVEMVKKYIDQLALHKFNRFHWHLTEDQGWRLEIKKYPKLQEVAACRSETLTGHYNDNPQRYDGRKYCGFYTQEEAREIVRYAAERFITVIPEIEMPGHAQAAIAAYPELGCTGKPVPVLTKWGVSEEVFCPNEATFEFLENVLTEVMAIFPSEYIHIGGDECPKTQWKASKFCQDLIKKNNLKDEHGLQSYFIQRMEKFLNANGRQIIGWDEILEGGLAPNATVMSWRGTDGGIAAAKQGHDVIMTPTDYCYLDYYQSEDPREPLAIGGYLPLEKVYSYNPDPAELSPEELKHIRGVQGNVWTEYISDLSKLEYMVFPRACALAEVAWSKQEARKYEDFVNRLLHHLKRLKAMDVQVANKLYDVKAAITAGDGKGVFVKLSPEMEGVELCYTTDGSEPSPGSTAYTGPVAIDKSCTFRAASFENGQPLGREAKLYFDFNKVTGKAITLTNPPAPKYSGGGPGSIVNGVVGDNDRYGGAEWLGFEGKDFEAVIDLGKPTAMSNLLLRFFNGKGQWIYPPKNIFVSGSKDGETYEPLAKVEYGETPDSKKIADANIIFGPADVRFLKIHAERYGIIPDGAQGAGHEAWLFVDEIIVR
jgi:hexosaminidase